MRKFVIVALGMLVAGCQTTSQADLDDPIGWGRFDCVSMLESIPAAQKFEQDKMVCSNAAQAQALAGTASMPGGYGVGGAIAAGINQGITANQIAMASAKACMADRGYMFTRRSEMRARCSVEPMKPVVIEKPKKRVKPAKPQAVSANSKPPLSLSAAQKGE